MTHQTQPLSTCCNKPVCADHECNSRTIKIGERCKCGVVITRYVCSRCNRPCDIATPDTEDELEKEIEFIVNPQPELSEMLEGNFTKLFKQLQKDLIRKLIRTEKLKVVEAVTKGCDIRIPSHGTCCTCQSCGYYYEDCVCDENIDKIINNLNAIREKLQNNI